MLVVVQGLRYFIRGALTRRFCIKLSNNHPGTAGESTATHSFVRGEPTGPGAAQIRPTGSLCCSEGALGGHFRAVVVVQGLRYFNKTQDLHKTRFCIKVSNKHPRTAGARATGPWKRCARPPACRLPRPAQLTGIDDVGTISPRNYKKIPIKNISR